MPRYCPCIQLASTKARSGVISALLVLFWLVGGVVHAQTADTSSAPETVKLAAQQTIEIKVGRWDPVEELYTAWEQVGGTFLVNTDGSVTLPLVGRLEVSGITTDQLSEQIRQKVQSRLGLRGDIEVVVSISAFAPIYVVGDVRSPGAYPHTPGMTVLQAMSLAGGVNGSNTSLVRGERGALSSLGSYRVLELELLRRLATLARLEAEVDGSEIVIPAELADAPMSEELIDQERQIMDARQSAFQSSLAQLDELEALLEQRINRLDAQAELRQQQLVLLEEELENAASLVERGLSTAARESNLQREVADQEVRLLEVETARLNAEQQLNETSRDKLDLTNERRRDLVQGLQEQHAAIGELRIRMETEASLFAESVQTGNGLVQLSSMAPPTLEITRAGPDGSVTFPVGRVDQIEGGDVLEVVLAAPEPNDSIPVRRLSSGTSRSIRPLQSLENTGGAVAPTEVDTPPS